MCYRFPSPFVHAVHGVHDINRLCILSAQKARQRLDRTTQIYPYPNPGKVITLAFFRKNYVVDL
jgi:hypothetical protein